MVRSIRQTGGRTGRAGSRAARDHRTPRAWDGAIFDTGTGGTPSRLSRGTATRRRGPLPLREEPGCTGADPTGTKRVAQVLWCADLWCGCAWICRAARIAQGRCGSKYRSGAGFPDGNDRGIDEGSSILSAEKVSDSRSKLSESRWVGRRTPTPSVDAAGQGSGSGRARGRFLLDFPSPCEPLDRRAVSRTSGVLPGPGPEGWWIPLGLRGAAGAPARSPRRPSASGSMMPRRLGGFRGRGQGGGAVARCRRSARRSTASAPA